MSVYVNPDIAELQAMARRAKAQSRALPSLPAGVGDDLADLTAQLGRINGSRTESRKQLADLRAERLRIERGNVTAAAAAIRSGDTPAAIGSLPAIDEQIAVVDTAILAADRAEEAVRRDLSRLIAANADRYAGEFATAKGRAIEDVIGAIDGLEAQLIVLQDVEAARAWIGKSGAGTVDRIDLTISTPAPESTVWALLVGIRAVLTAKPVERRPTHDEDGVPMTGWQALHEGRHHIGNPSDPAAKAAELARELEINAEIKATQKAAGVDRPRDPAAEAARARRHRETGK